MTRKIFFFILSTCALVSQNSCTPELTDDPIPFRPFNVFTINLTLPEYQSLRTDGGWKYLDGGVRGIILYRQNPSTYHAYERNCSFQPNNACATVNVHTSNLYMEDPCCNSSFNLSTGTPTGGPAWRPLNEYETILDGSNLTITDNIIN